MAKPVETLDSCLIISTKYKTNILDKLLTFTGHKEGKTAAQGIKSNS